MRVLVCGGRNFYDKEKIFEVLDSLEKVDIIIHGACSGADAIAQDWAVDNEINF
jgi:hypothetical protein